MLVVLVSGGNTLLVNMESHGKYSIIGQTIDDAAGEAFDKVARFLGLGHPGGPAIDREAKLGNAKAIEFPRAMLHDGFDVSFSGLKTAVVNYVRKYPTISTQDVAASFQTAVVDVLVAKSVKAAKHIGAKTVALGGGVAANSLLRQQMTAMCAQHGWRLVLPSMAMCTDNAAMIASAGWYRLLQDGPSDLSMGAMPNLKLTDRTTA
jgi:N6-L-threonylcarbamoyladenine synthase